MIKAIISDLYKVILLPRPSGPRYNPVGFNLQEACEINQVYLDLLKDTGLPVYILTNFRNSLLDIDLNSLISNYGFELFEAPQLGLDKASTYAYEFVAKNKLGLKTSEIAVIDDTDTNVNAALKSGATAVKYESNDQVASWLKTLPK